MEIFNYLKSEVKLLAPGKLVLYAFSGSIHFVIILLLIISALSVPDVHFKNVLLFSLLIYAFIRLQKNAMDESVRIIDNNIIQIRLRLVDQIRNLTLSSFETIDYNRFITILTQESQHICELGNLFPRLCSSIFLFCIAFLYISIISFPAFLLSILFIICGVQYYRINRAKHEKYLIEASHKEDSFFELLNQLLDGFKELKIHRGKNDDLYNNYLLKCAKEVEELKVFSSSQLSKSIIYANLFCYIFIAFLIFIFPEILEITQSQLIQIIAISLFITTGPIQEIVGSFPFIERANMAIKHLDMMEKQLQECEFDTVSGLEEANLPLPFESLHLTNVSFQYQSNIADSNFGIGPIDFEINQGEIIFIMGGNGAGKSTFLKVLVGLYPHCEGNIAWNDISICQQNRTGYQANFAVIFQDMHLFDRLYGIKKIDVEKAEQLLVTMKLADKTTITEDGAITNIRLSAGQKKRLALIISEMDDKQIYVFDEWAADQDPKFRKYFYEVYLLDLTKQGKTIIAITHDDHYYHIADHLFKMDYGVLTKLR